MGCQLVLVAIGAATVTGLSAATLIDPSALDKATPDSRYEILLKWAAVAEQGKQSVGPIQGPKVTGNNVPDVDWTPILERLVLIPSENPKLLRPTIAIFKAAGRGTPQSKRSCEAFRRLKQEEVQSLLKDIAELSATGIDDGAVQTFLRDACQQDAPDLEGRTRVAMEILSLIR